MCVDSTVCSLVCTQVVTLGVTCYVILYYNPSNMADIYKLPEVTEQ